MTTCATSIPDPVSTPPPAAEPTDVPSPRRTLRRQAGWILDTAFFVGRRAGMAEPDARDFAGWVSVRLMRRDFAVIRACRRPERLRGYLRRVIRNLAKDYRNHLWGKWRPTNAARRLGTAAVELERLCLRDGFSLDEAMELVRRRMPRCPTGDELEDLAGQLPLRPSRTQVEFDADVLGDQVAVEPDPTRLDSGRARSRVLAGLSAVLAGLDRQDREVLRLLFEKGRSVASIARELQLDQRALYSRRDQCLLRLRQGLEDRGLAWPDVECAFDTIHG